MNCLSFYFFRSVLWAMRMTEVMVVSGSRVHSQQNIKFTINNIYNTMLIIQYLCFYYHFQMLDSNTGQVLPLIQQHPQQEEKFVVNQHTLAHLRKYQANYCFVSICGDYRSGKSFLLNSLFFNYSGFETSSTTSSCTKGIRIWSEPIRCNDLCIWVIDTQGFGSIEKDSNYDGKIFLMNFLISNIILYNSFGAIDENSINKLAMICRQARALDQSTIQSKLFWILRDFSLQMTDKKGKQLSSDEYLEECLKENHNQNKSQKQFLRTLFKQRHCFALIRPLIDESKLNNLKEVSRIELREEFKSQISKLYDNIIKSAQSKMINGIQIGSHNIDILINDFVSTVNNGTIDCDLNCTYQKIMRHEHNIKKQAILSNLNTKIESLRKILPVQKHHINYLRTQVTENILQVLKQFQSHASGPQLQLLRIQTNNQINDAIFNIEKENKEKLEEEIKEYLHRQLIELYPKLIALSWQGFQLKFHQTFSQLKEQYLAKYSPYLVQQPFLQHNYNQFIQKQEKKVFFQIVKRWRNNSKEIEEKAEELKKSKKALEEEVKKLKEDKAKMTKVLQESKKEEAKAIQRMKNDVQQTFKEETRLIVTNYQDKLKKMTSQHDEQIIQLKLTITTLQQRLSHLSTQSQYEKQSLLQKISLQKQRAELLAIKWQQTKNNIDLQQQQRKNTYENKLKIAEMKYNQLQTSLSNERKKYQIISEQRKIEQNNLLQELADKNNKIDSLTEQLIHLEDRYKQELERILMEEKDIVVKTVTSKINQYEYKCRVYEAKLQEYAIIASEKEFYEQRSEELDIDNRQIKSLLEEEQDRNALLTNHISKYEKEVQQKQRVIFNLKDQHLKEMSLLNENLINNQHFMKESEQRHAQEIQWYKCKVESALRDQSCDLTHKYEESLQNYKSVLFQKFEQERQQLKEIIKNNYDQVENLKITIITLNSEMEKIFEILTRVLTDYQHFHKTEGESRRTSLRNSYLSDIAESPEEEYSEKMPSALKHQKIFRSTEFIAQEIEEIFVSLKEQIVLLTKERFSMKQELKNNCDQLDSFQRAIGKVKQENKAYRTEMQQLKRKLGPLESASKELQAAKQKCDSLQKENSQLRRELQLKEQLFISKDQNFKQNTIMYKEAIANLTDQTKILSSKLRQLTDINEDCQAELQRFKIWASQVKAKTIYPPQQVEMSAEKMKDLQNQIKRLAKKLQESKMQKLEKGAKRQVNIYSSILHQNRISELEALRAENEHLHRQLQQRQEFQARSLQEKKQSKQRQMEHQESRYSALKEEYQNYKKKSKETISMLQAKIDIYKEENKQLKQEYRELQGTIVQKYQFTKKITEQENEELKRQKQSLTQFYHKKVQSLQESLNSKSYDADKRIAEADLRFDQYRDQLQKQHNRIILQGERHRLKYEHLLKVNGELIKQIETLKSKAHQITIKQKYKSKISSLFDD